MNNIEIPENVRIKAEEAYRAALAAQKVDERYIAMPAAIQTALEEWKAEYDYDEQFLDAVYTRRRIVTQWEYYDEA